MVFETVRKNLYVVMVIVRRERWLGEGEETTCSIKDYSLSGGLQTIIVSSEENKTSSPEYVCIQVYIYPINLNRYKNKYQPNKLL
jgi:hypothetical protein